MGDEPIGLTEAIRRVRAELVEARAEAVGKDLRFRLGEVQLQFEVQLARETGVEGGIKLWVVSMGAKGGVSSAQTHTVSVSLVPQARDGDQWRDVMVGEQVAKRPPPPRPGHGS
jgi:hypothetical protein